MSAGFHRLGTGVPGKVTGAEWASSLCCSPGLSWTREDGGKRLQHAAEADLRKFAAHSCPHNNAASATNAVHPNECMAI